MEAFLIDVSFLEDDTRSLKVPAQATKAVKSQGLPPYCIYTRFKRGQPYYINSKV